jgi:hypothetical protein
MQPLLSARDRAFEGVMKARVHALEPPGAVWSAPVAIFARCIDHLPRRQSSAEISDRWRRRGCRWRRRRCCRCWPAWEGNRCSRSRGIANQHADELGKRDVALLQRGRWANAAKPLGRGGDGYRHLRTAGCRREAVLVPRNFVVPRPCAGAFLLARLLFAPVMGDCQSALGAVLDRP